MTCELVSIVVSVNNFKIANTVAFHQSLGRYPGIHESFGKTVIILQESSKQCKTISQLATEMQKG